MELRHVVNEQRNQIAALTGTLTRIADNMDKLTQLFDDPMKLYRTIFIPMYNGIRAAENDVKAEEKNDRRIDGTLRR